MIVGSPTEPTFTYHPSTKEKKRKKKRRSTAKGKAPALLDVDNDTATVSTMPVDKDLVSPTPTTKVKYIPVACRFVPTDQWFTTHLDPSWYVKEAKQWLLSRCIPDTITVPPQFRPSSPVTFARPVDRHRRRRRRRRRREDLDDIEGNDISTSDDLAFGDSDEEDEEDEEESSLGSSSLSYYSDDDSYDYDSYDSDQPDADSLDSVNGLLAGIPRRDRPRPPPSPNFNSNSNSNTPSSRAKNYSLWSYSDGIRLDDQGSLSWYHIPPFCLLEIHKAGQFVYLPRGDRYISRAEGEVVGYEMPWFCEEVRVKDGAGASKGEWRQRMVRIQNGYIEVLPLLSNSTTLASTSGQQLLRQICLNHMYEIGDGGTLNTGSEKGGPGPSAAAGGAGGDRVVYVRFAPGDQVGGDLWFSFPEGSTTSPHLLRILHRSHPDPATSLKTSFIDPHARMPKFARPNIHRDSWESLLDDTGGFGRVMSAEEATPTAGPGEAGSSLFRLDQAVQYPDWRQKVLERARVAGKGEKWKKKGPVREGKGKGKAVEPFASPPLSSSSHITPIEEIEKPFPRSVYQFWSTVRQGTLPGPELVNEFVAEDDWAPYDFPPSTTTTSFAGNLAVNDDEDVQSENEWELWDTGIERQVPRILSGMGGMTIEGGDEPGGLDFDHELYHSPPSGTAYAYSPPYSSQEHGRRATPALARLSTSPGRSQSQSATPLGSPVNIPPMPYTSPSPTEPGHGWESGDRKSPYSSPTTYYKAAASSTDIGHSPEYHPPPAMTTSHSYSPSPRTGAGRLLRHVPSEPATSTSPKASNTLFEMGKVLLGRPRSDNHIGHNRGFSKEDATSSGGSGFNYPHPTGATTSASTSNSDNIPLSPAPPLQRVSHPPRKNGVGKGNSPSAADKDKKKREQHPEVKSSGSKKIKNRMKGMKDKFNRGLDDALDFVDGK